MWKDDPPCMAESSGQAALGGDAEKKTTGRQVGNAARFHLWQVNDP
jgi:hypothetical protein